MFGKKKGASVAELGLLAGLIAIVVIGAVTQTGSTLTQLFNIAGNSVNAVVTGKGFSGIENPEDAVYQSCLDSFQAGNVTNGVYNIDVDGEAGPLEVVRLNCQMTVSQMTSYGLSETGWTVIDNDSEGKTAENVGCEAPSCRVFDITYWDADGAVLSDDIVAALATQSTEVGQNFYKSCKGSHITSERGSSHNAITKVGSPSKVSISRVTHLDDTLPDCEQNDAGIRREFDYFIRNKTDILPMKTIWGGDQGNAGEENYYRIGKAYLR